ncbi:hypothetical protein [Streptomyces sp. T028]|uniref:hypothetical protein n=1 Tax=Streptomyces sp. T028 TaxID=3394379 RepID=UPI003A8B132C
MQRVVAETVADWPAEDRNALARLLTRFVRDFTEPTGHPSPPAGPDGPHER